jgi:anaerobic magnesium-protoporphyrin IX monomethyl ester cyclase
MPLKVLLLNPPYHKDRGFNREGRCTQEANFWSTPWPPYSLASIAAVLRRDGHAVEVLDCPARAIHPHELDGIVERGRFDPIIAAVSTATVEDDLKALAALKAKHGTRIIIFGIHPTVMANDMIRSKAGGVDIIIMGEPEETAAELVAALRSGKPINQIQGIVHRHLISDGPVRTLARPYIEDLDSLPFPAWDLVDLGRYKLPVIGRSFIIINTVRGCPFPCTFCNAQAYYGTAARARSVPSLIAEIKHHLATVTLARRPDPRASAEEAGPGAKPGAPAAVRDIFFWGDTFTLLKDQVRSLCRAIIEERLDIRWVANSRVDTVDPETLALMKRAGCWMLSFGIESGDEEILRSCGKNITLDRIAQAVRDTRAAGILSAGHFIFGLPGETVRSARRTARFARRLSLDFANFYTAVPYPGSRLYEQALASGWIKDAGWARFSQSEFLMDLPTIDRHRLAGIRRRAKWMFYIHPRRLRPALSLIRLRF